MNCRGSGYNSPLKGVFGSEKLSDSFMRRNKTRLLRGAVRGVWGKLEPEGEQFAIRMASREMRGGHECKIAKWKAGDKTLNHLRFWLTIGRIGCMI